MLENTFLITFFINFDFTSLFLHDWNIHIDVPIQMIIHGNFHSTLDMERRGFTIHWLDACLPMEDKVEKIINLLHTKN